MKEPDQNLKWHPITSIVIVIVGVLLAIAIYQMKETRILSKDSQTAIKRVNERDTSPTSKQIHNGQ